MYLDFMNSGGLCLMRLPKIGKYFAFCVTWEVEDTKRPRMIFHTINHQTNCRGTHPREAAGRLGSDQIDYKQKHKKVCWEVPE